MDINNVLYSGNASQALKAQETMAKYAQSTKEDEGTDSTTSKTEDTYKKSDSVTSSDSGIYSKENIKKTIEQIEEQRAQAMTNMISDMLGQQANAKGLSFLNLNGNSSISVTQSDIDDASASISDGGYWSVDSVATRIMDMATMLAGGDESKLATLKEAVIKGFGGAMDKLGKDSLDDMPDITQKTYTEVMNRFDKWEQSFNTANAE